MNFYALARWRKARAQALFDAGYRCQQCGCSLIEDDASPHVHHRKPRARAPAMELEPLNLEAVCIRCHNKIEPRRAIDRPMANDDGSPTNADHPWHADFAAKKASKGGAFSDSSRSAHEAMAGPFRTHCF
jgi:5-methylcytosine-specific restriction endonuclease McrA